jgi:hypothetical protein
MSNCLPEHRQPLCPVCGINKIKSDRSKQCRECNYHPGWHLPRPDVPAPQPAAPASSPLADDLIKILKRGPSPLPALALTCRVTPGQALDGLLGLQAAGVNVREADGCWTLERAPQSGLVAGVSPFVSDAAGRHRFGYIGDTHLASKYARLDCLRDIYRRFADAGITTVFHTGNWIDGDASFNRYDVLMHGMDPQIRYLVQEYPAIPSLTTFAVAGNDHEGWYGKREGVDIGQHAQALMRQAGREDWVHLGHMEAFVPLQHAGSGRSSMLHVMHPGGGSAYAVSYTVQKIVEGYEGGEKPAVLLAGHYHKHEVINTRGVWVVQTACVQDQTPFARQKKLRFELGAGIVELEQDADSGAILGCTVEMFQYFNRGFYTNERWSAGGPVQHVPRVA